KAKGSGEFVDNKALAVFVKNCFGNHIRGDVSSSRAIAAAKTYEARFTHPPPRERVRSRFVRMRALLYGGVSAMLNSLSISWLDPVLNVQGRLLGTFSLSTAAFAAVLEARFNKIAYDPAGRKLGMGRELEWFVLAGCAERLPQSVDGHSPILKSSKAITRPDRGRKAGHLCKPKALGLRLRNEVHSQHDEADSKITGNTYIEILSNMSYYIDSSGCITSKEEDIDTQFRLTFAPNRFQYLPQSDFRARRSEHAIVLSTELSL
ncbi:unnamed protein product, partial [Fusarium fujikuroi]